MSTVFGVPCPECGQQLSVARTGELQCVACERLYRARMGHLFLLGEPPGRPIDHPAPATPAPS